MHRRDLRGDRPGGPAAAAWLAEHATGLEEVAALLRQIDIAQFAAIAGVDEQLVREAARRIAAASSVAVFEDLGVQMSLHSTLVSYLEKLTWLLTGNFAIPGGQYVPSSIVNLAGSGLSGKGSSRTSPVAGARIISGLVPCNVIAEEILTDHLARYRAMLVESGNLAHSLADSQRMREALLALDLLVVIDVSMTETARLAHYVLPAAPQYEKWEATFFNFDFPENVFHLRRPLLDPLPGTLGEPEIHARLCEALGAVTEADLAVAEAAQRSRADFAEAFFAAASAVPSSVASLRWCCTARSGRRFQATPQRRPCCGERRTGARSPTRNRWRGRFRHRARSRRGAVRRHHLVTVRSRVHVRRTRGFLDAAAYRRRQGAPRRGRAVRRTGRAVDRDAARR